MICGLFLVLPGFAYELASPKGKGGARTSAQAEQEGLIMRPRRAARPGLKNLPGGAGWAVVRLPLQGGF